MPKIKLIQTGVRMSPELKKHLEIEKINRGYKSFQDFVSFIAWDWLEKNVPELKINKDQRVSSAKPDAALR